MAELREWALIGDNNLERRHFLKEILENQFLLRAEAANTFDDLVGQLKEHSYKLILVAEDLPLSHRTPSYAPSNYLWELSTKEVSLGCIVVADIPAEVAALGIQFCCIHISPAFPMTEQRERVLTELGTINSLRRAPKSPVITLDDDPVLEEQIRVLSEFRSLKEGAEQLQYLVRDLIDCDQVEVSRLGQGLSGARVFRFRPQKGAQELGEFVIKLSPAEDLWKVELETAGYANATSCLGIPDYRPHVPKLATPRLPHGTANTPLSYAVSFGRWYAISYEFLGGGKFGKFIDLEAALVAESEELLKKTEGCPSALASAAPSDVLAFRIATLEKMLSWLCTNWYMNTADNRVRRDTRRIWETSDVPNREVASLPPYRFAGKTKGLVLGFLDSDAAKIGPRVFDRAMWNDKWATVRRLVTRPEGTKTGVPGLDGELSAILSPTHGDLNANNMFFWLQHEDQPFLIDFPFFDNCGHALQDLARLEVEVKFGLMDRQRSSPEGDLPAFDYTSSQIALWQEMEDHLLSDDWAAIKKESDWKQGRFTTNVDLSLGLVQAIRRKAVEVQSQQPDSFVKPFLNEYLPALLFHTVRAIGYQSLSLFKRLLAVYSSGSIIRILESAK
jgi:hypothetical protein